VPDRIPTHEGSLSPARERDYNRSRRGEQAFYKSARWLKVRLVVLQRDPVCTVCHRVPSTEVDHVLDRADRPDLELDESNLKGKCKPCHSRKTNQTQRARSPGGPVTVHTLR
jgi:5-methylcytosine-specific restriction protein A